MAALPRSTSASGRGPLEASARTGRPEAPGETGPATRLSIRTKLSIAVALAFAIAMGVGVQHMFLAVGNLHRGWHEERLRSFVERTYAILVADGLSGTDAQADALAARLAVHRQDRPLQLVEVVDESGVVVASSRSNRAGIHRTFVAPMTDEGSAYEERIEGERVATIVKPLGALPASAEVQLGRPRTLVVSSSLEPVEEHITALRKTIVITLLLTLGIEIVAVWVALTLLVVRPIREVVAVMQRVEDGDPHLRVSESLVADELNGLARSFNAMIDKQRRTQQELDASLRERMVRADRFATIGELASGLVHEIKNPLAGISGALQILANDREDAASRARVIQLMQEQVQRVDRVLRDLHAFARPNQPEHASVAVSELLERVLLLVKQHHAAASVVIEKELRAERRVRGHNAQLEQALMNICLNAAQAMERGGRLSVTTRDEGAELVLEIADTGPGIPAELRAKVFKPFFTTKARGTGLGLTIAAQIVEDHQGRLTIDCPPTGGTKVTIRLPAIDDAAASEVAP